MKKMLQRSISIILALSLCLVAMQFTALADTVTKAGFQTLSEWIEMADDLLSQGKEYASGKTEFDAAYNTAKSMLESESASDEEIAACIEDLKTAWAGLKTESITEIAPDSAIANDTGYANFGSSYKTASGMQPKIYYSIKATGADFWADVEMIYLYAYGYQTDSVTEELITGTTLPKGGKNATTNGIRLCTTDYVNSAYASSEKGYVVRNSVTKIEFSKAKLSKFVTLGKVSQIMFCYGGDNSPNATLCAGSLFIVRSSYEQVPVSYELYKWVNRAENLLAQGKTYTTGLDEFNAAINAAKNATDTDDVDTLIANIKTAWQALEYEVKYDLGYPVVSGGIDTTDTYEKESDDLGKRYVRLNSNNSALKVRFDSVTTSYYGVDWFNDVNEIYFYIRGYQTNATTSSPQSNYTLINMNSSIYVDRGPNVSTKLNKATIDVETFKKKLTDNNCKFQSLLLQQGEYLKASTWIVGTLYATKSAFEKLPSDRIFNWIERAEKILDMDVTFTEGIDEFNTAVEALYNADTTSDEDALIADLKAAWNNLTYDVIYEIGKPTIEKGTNITTSYTKEDDKLGSNYVCLQSNGTKMSVRLDCDIEGGFTTDWFEDVKEIFFYTRGYQTEDSTKAWSSRYTTTNVNNSTWVGGADVKLALSRFVIDKEALIKKLNGSNFKNILLNQNELKEASTWIVGSLFVTKSYNLSLADYGDVNGDGKVDAVDVVRAKKYLAGSVNSIADYSLDMNDDGKYAANDLLVLRDKFLNGEVKFADNIVSEEEVF